MSALTILSFFKIYWNFSKFNHTTRHLPYKAMTKIVEKMNANAKMEIKH